MGWEPTKEGRCLHDIMVSQTTILRNLIEHTNQTTSGPLEHWLSYFMSARFFSLLDLVCNMKHRNPAKLLHLGRFHKIAVLLWSSYVD